MILPLEVIALIAEHLAHPLTQTSPFLESTENDERALLHSHHQALLSLAISCRAVHQNIKPLLYTTLVIDSPSRVITALVDILRHPRIGLSIRHIRCCTQLGPGAADDESLQVLLLKHSQDIAWVEDALQQHHLRPLWWEQTNTSQCCQEGLPFPDYLEVSLLLILHMARNVKSFSLHQVDTGWARLASLRTAIDNGTQEQRQILADIQGLQCRLRGQDEWLALGEYLFSGGHENLQTLVLDGMSLQDMSAWSDTLRVKNTRIEKLYLGSRGQSKLPVRVAKREWVRGRWLAGGPGRPQLGRADDDDDDEGWGPVPAESRRREANLRGFRHLRVLDVVVDTPPSHPSRTLVALKNIVWGLEVLRVEGYPFDICIPDEDAFREIREAVELSIRRRRGGLQG